ncbi:winged helix-turn-helix transcriptional regulator [Streptomyces sp. NBC_01431]|uniref:LexA family protein n=1 Tax=Streptomyces sp. NBC_01431 TaxID=2903863 RepID=UPI002E37BF84|nr:winged helix-turn-helix transcriptional regulator [Streptomyces sp. NBC_01431]
MGHPPLPTPRQDAILAAMRDAITRTGVPPTIQELADAVGLASTSSIAYHLERLERQGIIIRMNGAGRVYRIC